MLRALAGWVAVVAGACAVAGTVTGSTLALWQDQWTAPTVEVRSGSMDLAVGAATPAALTSLVPGVPQTVVVPVTVTKDFGDRNVPVAVSVDAVASSNALLGAELRVAAEAADACTPATSGLQHVGPGYVPQQIAPDLSGEARVCLTFELDTDAAPTLQGASGNVIVTFGATQGAPQPEVTP